MILIANQNKATSVLAECIKNTAEKLIKRAGFDVTRNGVVTALDSVNKTYTVRVDGSEYTAKSLLGMQYSVADGVMVVFAQNRTPYIIGSTTRELATGGGGDVTSVNGQTGDVNLAFENINVTEQVGSDLRPVYLSSTGLLQIGHTIEANVPQNAVFTDTTDLTQMSGVLPRVNGGTGTGTATGSATRPVYLGSSGITQCSHVLEQDVTSSSQLTDTTDLTQMNGVLSPAHGGTGLSSLSGLLAACGIQYGTGSVTPSYTYVNFPTAYKSGTTPIVICQYFTTSGESTMGGGQFGVIKVIEVSSTSFRVALGGSTPSSAPYAWVSFGEFA